MSNFPPGVTGCEAEIIGADEPDNWDIGLDLVGPDMSTLELLIEELDAAANPAPIGSCYDCHVAILATDDYEMDTRATVDDYGDVLVCRDCTAHPAPRLRIYRSTGSELPL